MFEQSLSQHSADVVSDCFAARDMAELLDKAQLKLTKYAKRDTLRLAVQPWKREKEIVRPPLSSVDHGGFSMCVLPHAPECTPIHDFLPSGALTLCMAIPKSLLRFTELAAQFSSSSLRRQCCSQRLELL